MTPTEELDLYHDNREAWIRYVAPSTARKISVMNAQNIRDTWPLFKRDYQLAVWDHLSEEARARVTSARSTGKN